MHSSTLTGSEVTVSVTAGQFGECQWHESTVNDCGLRLGLQETVNGSASQRRRVAWGSGYHWVGGPLSVTRPCVGSPAVESLRRIVVSRVCSSGAAKLWAGCRQCCCWSATDDVAVGVKPAVLFVISNRSFTSSSSGNLVVKRSVSGSSVVQRSQAGA
ncbi:hypothetical protein FH972_020759 [Carpinus fangiana]|uniref:Uncharacterized protein n=1 Tax=Carpinus fangiana TaxID=176857 RepID=A0A5N6RXA9_9ROSI|nr:hypothetical protein FH972_020759 [Carpinus fangiana]